MKRHLLLLVVILLPLLASAYDIEIDGIYYNIFENEAEVTYPYSEEGGHYSGDVVIPESITYLDYTHTVTGIGDRAFMSCSDLTSVTLPNSIKTIGYSAFAYSTSLASVNIGSNVTSIGMFAFDGCSSLDNFVIPNSVTSVGFSAFRGTAWYDAQPDGFIYLDNWLLGFKDIEPTEDTVIEDGTIGIASHVFRGCNGLTSIEIPNSVLYLGSSAFWNCRNLTSVTFGNGVKEIGASTFSGCISLTSLTLGSNIASIGDQAFLNCYHLSSIKCLNPVPPFCEGISTFECSTDYVREKYDIYNYVTLHVPMGTKEAYSSAYEWRYFERIKEDMEMDGNVYYANLVVQQGIEGYTRQAVKTEEQYTIYIGSYGVNKINSVVFNGEDVTSSVVNGYYTTPVIKGASVLSITYDIDTAVNPTSLQDVKVAGYNGEIRVTGIDEPSDVAVYATDGKLVGNVNAALGTASLEVQGEQIYLVKVGNRTFKVSMP